MKWASIMRRWTMRSIHSTILGSALLGSASIAIAQTPSAPTNKIPEAHFTRSHSFDLPVRMDPDLRATVTEIRLYVKAPGGAWKMQESGPATLERFNCKVTQDGEYWFTLATLDRSNRMTPPDVALEGPGQRVIVDTALPTIQAQSHTVQGEFCLRVTVQDANPDYATLKAVCKTGAGDMPLEAIPNQPGVFRIKGAELLRFPVIVSVMDQAKNLGAKEVSVRDMIEREMSDAKLGQLPVQKGPSEIVQTSLRPDQKPVTAPNGDLPLPQIDMPPRNDLPVLPKSDLPPAKEPGNRVEVPNPLPLNPPPPTPPASVSDPILKALATPKQPTPPLPTEIVNSNSGPQQLINTTHASVEYRIDQVGPSGVGKVEIYMTPDKGQSWHRLGEDVDKRSPAEINLPGDGPFGIRVVVTNGNGFGGRAPVRGDAPHCTIEVDSTSPFVQLRSTDVLPSSGHVEIRWNATDKNLGAEPISLFYRTSNDGPWQVIARRVKNDGVHRWAFPRDGGSQFFFKLEVTDLAGNVSHDVSRQPIVIDQTEPRATVVGVTGAGSRPGGGQ